METQFDRCQFVCEIWWHCHLPVLKSIKMLITFQTFSLVYKDSLYSIDDFTKDSQNRSICLPFWILPQTTWAS